MACDWWNLLCHGQNTMWNAIFPFVALIVALIFGFFLSIIGGRKGAFVGILIIIFVILYFFGIPGVMSPLSKFLPNIGGIP